LSLARHPGGLRSRSIEVGRAFPRRGAWPGGGAVLGHPRAGRGDHRNRGLSGPPDLVLAAFHWLEYLGLLGGIGSFVVRRLGRVALIAFGVTALTGLLRATEQLPEVSDLWATEYGVVLMLKSAGVLAMLGVSLAWRRGWPADRAEAALAIAVVGATALLAAF